MKTQACKGAVCYIDLLGFSYLTEKLDSTVLYTNPDEEKPFGEKKIKELRICDLRQLDDYIKKGDNISKNNTTESDWAYNIVDTNLKKFHEIVEKQCQPYIISRKSGQKIPKIANLQYYKSKANYGTKKKGISR